MTRSDLSRSVTEYLGHQGRHMTLASVDAVLMAALDVIADQLAQNERIELRGFGSFATKHLPARNYPNPLRPAERVTVAAHLEPRFKPSARLRAAINPAQ